MYGAHVSRGAWDLMFHGNLFVQYLDDGSPRGHDQVGSINWFMAMARRPVGAGRFGVNVMLSAEPWTVGGCGYPDLLATGESCDGHPIVDRQHPHDLVMEAAVLYERPLGEGVQLQLYGGPAGEPALGPVAFPHRVSALSNLLAPISHHWMDATHITFGVATAGVYGRRWKAEASVFNGREPDEDRLDLDLARLDSYSGRFWFLPTAALALQVSAGRLNEAEPGHDEGPRVDVNRVTASATYHRLTPAVVWATTFGWGRNTEAGESSHFAMAETTITRHDRDSWFGRIDAGGKAAHDLDVHGADETFTVAKLQGGYIRYFSAGASFRPGIGAVVGLSVLPRGLTSAYGSRTPVGFGFFLTLRPAAMSPSDPHAGHVMP